MPTNFQHHLILVVPAAKVATVVAWLQANVSPTAVPADLGPGLNPSGLVADPVTHRWCSGAFQDSEAKAILAKLCQLAGVTPPTNVQWNGWTRSQKIAWLQSVQAALLSGYGVYVMLSPQDGAWDNPQTALTALGIKVIAATPTNG
jgi:hypothetical protein